MKNVYKILLGLVAIAFLGACSKVPSGYAGVKIYLLGGSKGVDHEVLGPGRYWIGWNTDLFLFPMFQQNYTWTKDHTDREQPDDSFTFQTKEGMGVGLDVGLTYHIDHEKVSELFQKYREPLDEITHKFLRRNIQDAINRIGSKMAVEETYGVGKSAFFDSVLALVRRDVQGEGILIDKIYLIGTFRLPGPVMAALDQKIAATQDAQKRENMVQTARAQAEIEVATAEGAAKAKIAAAKGDAEATLLNARAVAEAMRLKRDNMTDVYVRYVAASAWDGHLPTTMASGSVPFLNLGMGKAAEK